MLSDWRLIPKLNECIFHANFVLIYVQGTKEYFLLGVFSSYMFLTQKARVDWESVQDAFTKPRRLHLEKGSDGVHHCPVTGCEHTGFSTQRGCRKHVKTKHGWYYYFDDKPNVCDSPVAIDEIQEKTCKMLPSCSTDNEFARSFSQWLQSSCGGGKSQK